MHILLTGVSGRLGSHTLKYLLLRGHTITALDMTPLPPHMLASLSSLSPDQQASYTSLTCDLTDYKAFEQIMLDRKPEAVIHLGAIPDPMTLDPRVVHNNNVTGSYNVLQTAAALGVRRIVQASSVNATGLSYSPAGHQRLREMPVTETHPILPNQAIWPCGNLEHRRVQADKQEDPYALSKAICELQASALCRYYPGLRIASLRFHMVTPDYATAVQNVRPEDGFAWTSLEASASACLRGILSDGWDGAEAFNIAAPEICWEGGLTPDSKSRVPLDEKRGTVELVKSMWGDKVSGWDETFWKDNARRTTFSSAKAERMLGWDHDTAGDADL